MRLPNFTVAHAGAFWEQVRDEFPTSQHAAPLATPNLEWVDASTGLPLPRLWFVSRDKQGLLQLQGDCIFYNWRRNTETDVYPRYANVLGQLQKYMAKFEAFLSKSDLGAMNITGSELTYVNHIPQEQGWTSTGDLSAVFRDLRWVNEGARFLPVPKDVTWKLQFALPDSGTLSVSLGSGTRVRDKMPTLKLELSARVAWPEQMSPEGVWKWLDVAHEWIVRGFCDLTQEDIQRKLWKRTQ